MNILDILGIKVKKQAQARTQAQARVPAARDDSVAAQAIADALDADTGRRKSLKHWRPIVGQALGISRLRQKRYDAVLAKGVELGLFTIDDSSGSYPFLVRHDSTPPDDPEPVDEDEEVRASREQWQKDQAQRVVPPPPPPLPDDWTPPLILDCGHTDWSTEEEHEAARAEGFCCAAGKRKHPPNYMRLKGEYVRPVPKGVRRTPEKVAMGGWPGLCCDEKGYYIGGPYNNCRREGRLCTYHADPKDEP